MRVRVLVMAHQWLPGHNAGAEVMLHAMLRALVARGHGVDVTLSRQAGEPYELDGLRLWPGRDPRTLLTDVHVIVTHLENTPAATLLGRWHGLPVVQVLHNTMAITKRWAPNASLLVANSLWMQRDFIASFDGAPRPRVIVVHPPVLAADYATTPGDRVTLVNLRPDETSPDGVTLGKGAELFWQLAELMPDVHFLGVKGAYGAQMVRDLPNVEVIEHVPHDRMRDEVYARTRVLLMPSNYESWGRTAVEAMASGIPVIAHPTPGLIESLDEAGLFLDRTEAERWVQVIRALERPRAYRHAAARSRRRAAELDPTEDLTRWCDEVEALAMEGVPR